jgi:glycosyltransferase involved in cell wall biosynthesis
LNKVIDYMIAGKPIIASYSGYPSMINEAQCGVFVPAEDMAALRHAIYEYQKMPKEQLQAIGARGREWLLNNRSYGKLAQDYLEVLK